MDNIIIEELRSSVPEELDNLFPDYFQYLKRERKRFVFYPGLDKIMFSSCMDEYLHRRGEEHLLHSNLSSVPVKIITVLGQMTGQSESFAPDFRANFMEINTFKAFFNKYSTPVINGIKKYLDFTNDPRIKEKFMKPFRESILPTPYDKKIVYPEKKNTHLAIDVPGIIDDAKYLIYASYCNKTVTEETLKEYLEAYVHQSKTILKERSFFWINESGELEKISIKEFLEKPLPPYFADTFEYRKKPILPIFTALDEKGFYDEFYDPRSIYVLYLAAIKLNTLDAEELFLEVLERYIGFGGERVGIANNTLKKQLRKRKHNALDLALEIDEIKNKIDFLNKKALDNIKKEIEKAGWDIKTFLNRDFLDSPNRFFYIPDSIEKIMAYETIELWEMGHDVNYDKAPLIVEPISLYENDNISTTYYLGGEVLKETFLPAINNTFKDTMKDFLFKGELFLYDQDDFGNITPHSSPEEIILSYIKMVCTCVAYFKLIKACLCECEKTINHYLITKGCSTANNLNTNRQVNKEIYGKYSKNMDALDEMKYGKETNL